MPSFEVLLPVGAVALYLYDSAQALYGDELLLERRGRGWRASAGGALLLAGRRPCLPNPFTPGSSLFRVRWDRPNDDGTLGAGDVDAWCGALRPLRGIVLAQLALLVGVLPPVSVALGAGTLLLGVFALYYLLSLLALAVLVSRRRELGLATRQLWLLAFESLACAPFAVNLLRKVSLSQSARLRWLEVASTEFDDAARRRLGAVISASIAAALAVEDAGTPGAARLASIRASLGDRLGVVVGA